jgi:hypothetical protein
MEILMDDEVRFYYHNATIIPYGSKNIKTHGIKSSIFLTLTIHDTKKCIMTILHGNKKKQHLSKIHFNTMFGNRDVTSSEPISKKVFLHKISKKI